MSSSAASQQVMQSTDQLWPAREGMPTMYDLPYDKDLEEPGLPDQLHEKQPQLLEQTFCPPRYPAKQRFAAADMNLYYDPQNTLRYKRPDWFAVVGVPWLYAEYDMRYSYVVWDEQVIPSLVVELLSPGTEQEDQGLRGPRTPGQPPGKWQVYEDILKIPYYVIYGRRETEMRAFVHDGVRYQEQPSANQRLWLPQLEIGIGLWHGEFALMERDWLRFYDAAGNWILTPAEQERARAEQERTRAEQERIRADHQQARADHQQARAEHEQARAEQERTRADHQQARAEQEQARAKQERALAAQAQDMARRYREKLLELGIDPD